MVLFFKYKATLYKIVNILIGIYFLLKALMFYVMQFHYFTTYKSHNTEIDVKYLIDMKRRKIKYKLFTTKCGHTDI
jgi:hypothetical protein